MRRKLPAEAFPYIEDYKWDMKLGRYVLVSRRPNPKYKGKDSRDTDQGGTDGVTQGVDHGAE